MYTADEKRYDTMRYNRCGRSGLKLPVVSLGLWHNFGDFSSYDNMKQMCFTAFDHGITHFDLANNYGPEYGSAEKHFGLILKEHLSAYRDELIISSKAGYDMWKGPYGNWGSRKYLAARECQKGIISFSPLAQGMLTDRYLNGIPEDSRIKTDGRFLNQEKLAPHIEQIKKLNDIATKRGETLAQMALKWVVKDDDVTSVLVGASKPQQILENLKVMEGTGFSEEELRMIDEVVGV